MYYDDDEFTVYFVKFYHSFFWPNLIPQSGIFQIDRNLAQAYIVICDYAFDVFFPKCSPLSFSGKFGLKILLQLLIAKFFVFLNEPHWFSETRVLGLQTQGYILCTLHRQRCVREGVIYSILATL